MSESDIVRIFRSYALDKDNFPRMGSEVIPTQIKLLTEAADTITALRAENERLTDIVDGFSLDPDYIKLREENERLRAALWKITHNWEVPMEDKAWRAVAKFMWDTARAALEEKP